MQDYLKSLVRPSAVFSNVLIAGFQEAHNFPHEVGISSLLNEDNRFTRIGDGNVFKRFGSVVKSTVVASSTRGGQTLALGQIAGVYGSWAIASQVWKPASEQRGSHILLWGSVNLAAKGGRNLIREFGPDLRQKLSHH